MYKRILYATDDSMAARKALDHARDLAKLCGAEVYLVHAFRNIEEFSKSPYFQDISPEQDRDVETAIGWAFAQLRGADLVVHIEPCEGQPAEAILKVARIRSCDLIVIGAHDHGTLTGKLSPGVSDQLLHYALCPVLIVR